MSWRASWSGRTSSASEAKSRSRSWRQRQVGRVDDDVGLGADRVQHPPFLGDRLGDAPLVAQRCRWRVSLNRRMRTSSLASRNTTRGLMPDPPARRASPRAPGSHRPSAHRPRSRPARTARRSEDDELGQVGQQLAGQVVDDRVAEVLEELGRRGLAAAGQPGQDHDRFAPRHRRRRPLRGAAPVTGRCA